MLAEVLAGLTPQQWETPSLCGAWTARAVATHLLLPLVRGVRGFLPDLVRARGSLHDASELGVARAMERMTTAQVVAGLRAQAGNRFRPPTMPPAAPLTEVLVHGQDILVPLGIDFRRPVERWEVVLGFLTECGGAPRVRARPAPRRTAGGSRLRVDPRLRTGGRRTGACPGPDPRRDATPGSASSAAPAYPCWKRGYDAEPGSRGNRRRPCRRSSVQWNHNSRGADWFRLGTLVPGEAGREASVIS